MKPVLPSQRAPDRIVLQPASFWPGFGLKEMWEYRELLYFLTWRDVKVRYKQTLLGVAWAVIQPLFMMVVFTVVLGRLARVPSEGLPYPVFSFVALVPWTFFSNGLTQSASSLVSNSSLITRVYFPRLIIPISSILVFLVDFICAFAVLLGLMMYYGISPARTSILLVPCFLVLALVVSVGVGLWLSAINIRFRDVRHAVPFVMQLWLFLTPVAYPGSLVKGAWSVAFSLNPMVGVIEGFRWSLVGGGEGVLAAVAVSAAVGFTLLVTGALYFRHTERVFADVA